MKILALDLGTKTGWAYSKGGSGVWDLTPLRHESAGMRWIKFNQSLRPFVGYIDIVVYEEIARHLGTHAAHIYGGLIAILQAFCQECHIEYQGVPVGTIKKFATGKGNADKIMMIQAANRIMGWTETTTTNIDDDNEADAICLLAYAKDKFQVTAN